MSDKAQTTTVASGKRRQFLVDSARLACGVGLLGVGMGFYAEHAKALPPAALRPPGALPESELAAACIRCGLCADNCPAGAIPKAAPQKVDKHKCISCLRCIQICPQSARGVPLPLRLAAAATVKKYCTGRKEPKFYL